jgi:hypothetical protein
VIVGWPARLSLVAVIILGRKAPIVDATAKVLRKTNKVALIALLAFMSGCQSQPVTYYAAPEGMPLEVSATLVGSKVPVRNIFYADEITYVQAVDGLPVQGGSESHDIPLQLSPGKHAVRVGFVQGSGCAQADFELAVKRGGRYTVRGEKLGRESLFRPERLRIWIEDSQGDQVTDDSVVQFDFCGGGFGLIVVQNTTPPPLSHSLTGT